MVHTFSSINPNAKLFQELKTQMPDWWIRLIDDNDLYINIRKDNSINVYYHGGSLARIEFKRNAFKARIHQKYLGDFQPRGKTKNGTDKSKYDLLNVSSLDKETIESIKARIKILYSNCLLYTSPSPRD